MTMRSPFAPLRVALWATLVALGGILVAGSIGWGAPAEYEQAIGEVSRWCERVSGGILREPINTLGNLGFVVFGLAILWVLARDKIKGRESVSPFVGLTPIALLYGFSVWFLGPGSMLMHGSHTFFGAWMDNVSMVAYILIPWLYNLSRLGRWENHVLFKTYGAILAAYAMAFWFFGKDLGIGLDLFGTSIAIWLISEILFRFWSAPMRYLSGFAGFGIAAVFGISLADIMSNPGEYWWTLFFWLPGLLAKSDPGLRRTYTPWFWLGVASFFAAYAIWLTGTADSLSCNPDSLIQAHAIWHLLTAISTWCFFKFLRTESTFQDICEI